MNTMSTDLLLGESQSHELEISVFVGLICLCILVGHLLEPYRWLNESIAAVFLVKFPNPNPSFSKFCQISINFAKLRGN